MRPKRRVERRNNSLLKRAPRLVVLWARFFCSSAQFDDERQAQPRPLDPTAGNPPRYRYKVVSTEASQTTFIIVHGDCADCPGRSDQITTWYLVAKITVHRSLTRHSQNQTGSSQYPTTDSLTV